MAKYILQQYAPDQLNIDFKENNQRLNLSDQELKKAISQIVQNELPLQNKHLLTIWDYQKLQNRLFQLIKYLDLLINYNDQWFAKFWQNIDENLKQIIILVYKRITSYNGKHEHEHEHVIESITINNKTKKYQNYNKGVIDLGDNYIPSGDYVNSYNDLDGDVYGISGVIINGETKWPDINGNVNIIDGLIPKQKLVNTFNHQTGNITGVISSVTSGYNDWVNYNEENKGIINITDMITKYINPDEYAPKFDAPLSSCSAITYNGPINNNTYNIIATKEYIDNKILSSLAVNFVNINKKYWELVSIETQQYYQLTLNVPSSYYILNLYKYDTVNTQKYNLVNINNYIKNIIIDENNYITNVILTSTISEGPFQGLLNFNQYIEDINFTETNGNITFTDPYNRANVIIPSAVNDVSHFHSGEQNSYNLLQMRSATNQINYHYVRTLYVNPPDEISNSYLVLHTNQGQYEGIDNLILNKNVRAFFDWAGNFNNEKITVPLRDNLLLTLDGHGSNRLKSQEWIVKYQNNEDVKTCWFDEFILKKKINNEIYTKTISTLVQENNFQGLWSKNICPISGVVTLDCVPYGNEITHTHIVSKLRCLEG